MSKKCPYCSSYNTELSVKGNIEYGFKGLARWGCMLGAYTIGGLAGPAGSQTLGREAEKSTRNWTGDVKRHHCCNCGRDFK